MREGGRDSLCRGGTICDGRVQVRVRTPMPSQPDGAARCWSPGRASGLRRGCRRLCRYLRSTWPARHPAGAPSTSDITTLKRSSSLLYALSYPRECRSATARGSRGWMRRPQSQLCRRARVCVSAPQGRGAREPGIVLESSMLVICCRSTCSSWPVAEAPRKAHTLSISQVVVIWCRPSRADLIGAQRRVVQAPVVQIVVGAVGVPAERGQITADHPRPRRRAGWSSRRPRARTTPSRASSA